MARPDYEDSTAGDDSTASTLTPELEAKLEEANRQIAAGEVHVATRRSTGSVQEDPKSVERREEREQKRVELDGQLNELREKALHGNDFQAALGAIHTRIQLNGFFG